MVLAEVQKVEQWKQHCRNVAGASAGDANLLTSSLLEVYLIHALSYFSGHV